MTQLMGSRGPVTTSLQHNAEAMHELDRARGRHDSLLDDAVQAAQRVATAEMHVEQMRARLTTVRRRTTAATDTDAVLGTDRAGSFASEADQLEQDIVRAEQALRDAQRAADRLNTERLDALNAFHALKAKVYAPSPDIVEEG